jgi:hypothetical protein
MRSARSAFIFCLFLFAFPVRGRQTQPATSSSTATARPPATKDPQALSVLNQAISAAGGGPAVGAIKDYTATGSVTFHGNQDVQGTVQILGLGPVDFRLDANLPKGVHSLAIHEGQTTRKAEDGTVSQIPPPLKVAPSSDVFPYRTPMFPGTLAFPHRQLMTLVNSPRLSLSYKGLVQINGHSVHDIQVLSVLPGTAVDPKPEYSTTDYFIDADTFQVVMVQDTLPKHVLHQIRYSDYRAVNGVLVPFSISEEMGSQPIWVIQLGQFTFNVGLQDSAFAL